MEVLNLKNQTPPKARITMTSKAKYIHALLRFFVGTSTGAPIGASGGASTGVSPDKAISGLRWKRLIFNLLKLG
jgi:hypothetical protein